MTSLPTAISTWAIDPVRSVAEFAVTHRLGGAFTGRVRSLTGTLVIDDAIPTNSAVTATIAGQLAGPGPLRTLRQEPPMSFRSTRVTPVDDIHWQVVGDLTIRDVTREAVLVTRYGGQRPDGDGRQRATFVATTTLSRTSFGLRGASWLDAGDALVSDRVHVTLHIVAVRQHGPPGAGAERVRIEGGERLSV
jgi:polyisoprenoid-binding protein YceI